MKPKHYTNFLLFVAAVTLAACSASSTGDDKQARLKELKTQQSEISAEIKKLEEEIAKANPETVVKAKDVAVVTLAARPFDYYIQTQGSVEAEDNILVSSKTMGVVSTVLVKEGQEVSKGQTLAQIDNSIIMRGVEAMKSQVELATTVYERQKNLWNQKIGTEVQYLQAKTNKESLEKQLASLQEQNDMTRIKSPINGTVDAIAVKAGENIAPGMPAVRVVNTSDLKLMASVSEAFVTDVKKGNKVLVNIPELKRELEARVTFVGKTIDPLSRTFAVEVALPSYPNLRPNMTGVIKVVFNTEPAALTVPVNVVQDVNDEKIVYIAEANGKKMIARRKVVTVAGVYGGYAHVAGLKVGDKVISVGYQGLNDGDNIKL